VFGNQPLEVPGHAEGQRPIANQQADLDVAVERRLRQIGRSDEDRGLIGYHRLRVKHTRWTIQLQ